jgi:hypothetical protein
MSHRRREASGGVCARFPPKHRLIDRYAEWNFLIIEHLIECQTQDCKFRLAQSADLPAIRDLADLLIECRKHGKNLVGLVCNVGKILLFYLSRFCYRNILRIFFRFFDLTD